MRTHRSTVPCVCRARARRSGQGVVPPQKGKTHRSATNHRCLGGTSCAAPKRGGRRTKAADESKDERPARQQVGRKEGRGSRWNGARWRTKTRKLARLAKAHLRLSHWRKRAHHLVALFRTSRTLSKPLNAGPLNEWLIIGMWTQHLNQMNWTGLNNLCDNTHITTYIYIYYPRPIELKGSSAYVSAPIYTHSTTDSIRVLPPYIYIYTSVVTRKKLMKEMREKTFIIWNGTCEG